MKKKLIIIRGIPGSGKSTYAKKLLEDLEKEGISAKHYEADMFFMKNGEYVWNPMLAHKSHEWCFNKVFKSLEVNDVVIVSNTFTTQSEMDNYLTEAKNNDYDVTVYRMANEFQNQHGVPEQTLEKMKARFTDFDGEIIIKES